MKDFLARYNNDVDELELFKVLEEIPKIVKDKMWLAGGAIRRTLIQNELDSDFDFFFKDKETLESYAKLLEKSKARKTAENEHQVTYCLDVKGKNRIIQLVRINYYQNPESVLDSFDFTITQFLFDGDNLYCGKHSLWDLARRKLALHKLTFGVATMRRLIKYTKQDFTACAGVMQSILEAVVEDPSVVNANVQYID
ncbi:hypothetical protein [Paenibacillus xylanexedens]|uniref:hypothetical protein n=1 Tax=Paenibacillus xylanexedens TaxID=528191 RepID=UPI0011A61E0D|nr:hypothetical protein [Paenibacillus xylanexedens]